VEKWEKMEMGDDGDGGGGMVVVKGGAAAQWLDGGVGDGGSVVFGVWEMREKRKKRGTAQWRMRGRREESDLKGFM
jgi:hypothetical protein